MTSECEPRSHRALVFAVKSSWQNVDDPMKLGEPL
jgi:hypothetical protein